MATPKPFNNQEATTNAHGVERPVRALKPSTKPAVDRQAIAKRLKDKHSVAFEKLAKH